MSTIILPSLPGSMMFSDGVMTREWQNFFRDLMLRIGGYEADWGDTVELSDSDDSHVMSILWGENDTSNRTLSLAVGGADRTITLSGNPTLGNWFDQSVKVAASPSFAGLGIGTSTPRALVDLLKTSGPQLRLTYADNTVYSNLQVDSGGNLTITPTGDLILSPTGGDVLPSTNYGVNLGSVTKKWLTIHAGELYIETLVAQGVMATIGGRVLIGPTTTLTSDLGSGDTTIYVKHNNLASGDRAYLEANSNVEFIAITSAPSGTGPYSYTVTRNLDGSGANSWVIGNAVFNTGTTGDGFIDLYSIAGILSGYGPTIVGNVRNSATYNDWTEHWAIGNLKGLYGYANDAHGAAFGKYSGADYLTIDSTNGVRFLDSADVVQAQLTGGAWTMGQVAASNSNIQVTSGAINFRNNTTVVMTIKTDASIEVAGSMNIISGGKITITTADALEIGASGGILVNYGGVITLSGGTTDNKTVISSNAAGLFIRPYTTGTDDVRIGTTAGGTPKMWDKIYIYALDDIYLDSYNGDVLPSLYQSNLGDATRYWGDVSYKTLTDRGCLGWFDDGVEMADGSVVSDLEAISLIRKDNRPEMVSVHGVPRLDYRSMPKAVYRKAAIKGRELPRDENDKPYNIEDGNRVPAEDGAEMSALISIMLGAIKQLNSKIEGVENAGTPR